MPEELSSATYGSIGAFQGDLNPTVLKAIIDTCVMLIHLYIKCSVPMGPALLFFLLSLLCPVDPVK